MLATRLIRLIESHAESITREVVKEIFRNEHTSSYALFSKAELHSRVFALYRDLGNWIGNPKEGPIQLEYEELGRLRHRQKIPLHEIVYTLIIIKQHLRRYIRENGLVVFSGDRIVPGEMLPFELQSIQELNYLVGDFFDRALYHLTRGYDMERDVKHGAQHVAANC